MKELQIPLFAPKAKWVPPLSFPSIPINEVIAIDTETCDPTLKTRNTAPGYITGEGNIVGISIAYGDSKAYFPFGHRLGGNLDKGAVISYFTDLLKRTDLTIVFANATYDLGWLSYHGIKVAGVVEDVILNAALLDEERDSYSLQAISTDYGFKGKSEAVLKQTAKAWGLDPKADMWQLHSSAVGEYAEDDAWLTLQVYKQQLSDLHNDGLCRIHRLEKALIPAVFGMTHRGIRVNISLAEELNDRWKKEEKILLDTLKLTETQAWSPQELVRWFAEQTGERIRFPKAEKGGDSVTNSFLKSISERYPIAHELRKYREMSRCRGTFVEQNVLNLHTNGRVHPMFIQMAREDGGTRTGRFASKNPNMQQIPTRSETFPAKLIRHIYLPEEGEMWAKSDYSSQEPRLQVHYGLLKNYPGAKEAAEAFRKGIKLYSFMADEAEGIDYHQCKTLVLGKSYGMGKKKLAESLGVSYEEGERIGEKFDESFAYISMLAQSTQATAQRRGSIFTLMGRKRRFDWFQSADHWDLVKQLGKTTDDYEKAEIREQLKPVKGEEAAKKKFGRKYSRAFCNKALNSLIQGGSSDQTKQAMLNIYEAGHTILSQVHDELNCSVPSEREANEIKEIMEQAVELRLPVVSDLDLGEHWI